MTYTYEHTCTCVCVRVQCTHNYMYIHLYTLHVHVHVQCIFLTRLSPGGGHWSDADRRPLLLLLQLHLLQKTMVQVPWEGVHPDWLSSNSPVLASALVCNSSVYIQLQCTFLYCTWTCKVGCMAYTSKATLCNIVCIYMY